MVTRLQRIETIARQQRLGSDVVWRGRCWLHPARVQACVEEQHSKALVGQCLCKWVQHRATKGLLVEHETSRRCGQTMSKLRLAVYQTDGGNRTNNDMVSTHWSALMVVLNQPSDAGRGKGGASTCFGSQWARWRLLGVHQAFRRKPLACYLTPGYQRGKCRRQQPNEL